VLADTTLEVLGTGERGHVRDTNEPGDGDGQCTMMES
jgi:hypothetical protein